MHLVSVYTPEFDDMARDWLLGTLRDAWDLQIVRIDQQGDARFGSAFHREVNQIKCDVACDAIRRLQGDVVVLADVDIQFFDACEPLLREALRQADVCGMAEANCGPLNGGFLVVRCTGETARLWERIRDDPGKWQMPFFEQELLNRLLTGGDANGIRFRVLPDSFWSPASGHGPPDDLLVHHATCAAGTAEKIRQLRRYRYLKTRDRPLIEGYVDYRGQYNWSGPVKLYADGSFAAHGDVGRWSLSRDLRDGAGRLVLEWDDHPAAVLRFSKAIAGFEGGDYQAWLTHLSDDREPLGEFLGPVAAPPGTFDRSFAVHHLNTYNWFNYAGFYRFIATRPGFRRFAEVGVWKGHSLAFLAGQLAHVPGVEIYGIDLFDGSRDAGLDQVPADEIRHAEAVMELNLTNAGVRPLVRLVRECSWLAVAGFDDAFFDFVFIGASHDAESVAKDLDAWLPKVRGGGIIAGHDYSYASVRDAVHARLADVRESPGDVWFARRA
jgi:hypothetical protein